MKTKSLIPVLAIALCAGAVLQAATIANPGDLATSKAPPGSKQWPAATPLFAPNLSNVSTAPGAWSCKDGVFTGKGVAWTKAAGDNFYLSLEFRAQAKADGGIFLRCSDTKDYVQNSIEVQILQGDPAGNNERALVGALYDLVAPSRQVEIEPGAWHKLLIRADNEKITVWLDDERLVRADLEQWTAAGKNPGGTGNKFKKALRDFARSGVIGLHAAEGKIEYRNLFIEALPPPPVAAPVSDADASVLLSFLTATPWTAKIGKGQNTSTFTLHPDNTYTENWMGKNKKGTWRVTGPATIALTTPEKSTLVFTADPGAGVLRRRGSATYTPTNPAALQKTPSTPVRVDDGALLSFLTATPWTGKLGKNTSTFTLHPDNTYTENWMGKNKKGTWRVTGPATIALTTPEKNTLVFTADQANRVLRRRGSAIYTPTNPAALDKLPPAAARSGSAAPFAGITYLPSTTPAAETEDWTTKVPVVKAPAGSAVPSDATVLFDGSGLDAWESTSAKETSPRWKVAGGILTPVEKTGSLRTKASYGDVQVHLEFRTQTNPVKSGQQRGNSGLIFMGLYEFQVLDSHENPTYANGQAASVYKQHPPLANASRAPGEWQSYDVVFIAPRFNAAGELVSPARITAFHNGILVQHGAILTGPTVHRGRVPYAAHPAKLPLVLQNHATDRPSFRNIWLRELSLPASSK
ncbi:hypothetical protein M2447_001322 [Ereboglobus sp. PH5-10]|uniref:3-keto-disaccharide hydrolase n=1 Tax=Ereboglobus sp. PH5-10 TaxID=2940629 RepID=UPI0024055985|nr:DUF1080 domain-containing protein [Ereboglobus sp. PH5-10]MDF9827230.1 hypothetical protein [Ereboglobus sp. PH5-10]